MPLVIIRRSKENTKVVTANLLLLLSFTAKKTHKTAAATQAAESPKISKEHLGREEDDLTSLPRMSFLTWLN